MAEVDCAKAIVKALADKMKERVKDLQEVIYDFPEPNYELKFPSVSIQGNAPVFTPLHPYVHEQEEVEDTEAEAIVKHVTGQYDFKLQLDLWASSNEERSKLYEQIMAFFSEQFPVHGLSLQLADYHDVWARYDISGYTFNPDGAEAQRKEFRASISLLAHCKCVLERREYLVKEGEISHQVTDQVITDEVPDEETLNEDFETGEVQ